MACVDPELQNNEFCDGEHNLAGNSNQITVAFMRDIQTWPTIGDSDITDTTTFEKKGWAKGAFVMKTGRMFTKHTLISDSSEVETKTLNENSAAMETTLKLRFQNTKTNAVLLRSWLGAQLVLQYFPNEGASELLGKPGYPVIVKEGSIKNGTAKNGEKFIEITFSYMPYLPLSYSGTVPLTAAV